MLFTACDDRRNTEAPTERREGLDVASYSVTICHCGEHRIPTRHIIQCALTTITMPKILLVEDNEMNRDMLSRRLLKRGFEVVIAVDGGEGVALAQSSAPDLILMDMSLPVLDGWEATRRIKADPTVSAIPVIALTAHAMSGDEQKAREAGCDDFDTKPVDFARLMSKIEAFLPPT